MLGFLWVSVLCLAQRHVGVQARPGRGVGLGLLAALAPSTGAVLSQAGLMQTVVSPV